LNQVELSVLLNSRPSTISETVEELRQKGFCTITREGRSNYAEVTEAGMQALIKHAELEFGVPPDVVKRLASIDGYPAFEAERNKSLEDHIRARFGEKLR